MRRRKGARLVHVGVDDEAFTALLFDQDAFRGRVANVTEDICQEQRHAQRAASYHEEDWGGKEIVSRGLGATSLQKHPHVAEPKREGSQRVASVCVRICV
jgi:hypothetical protein